jgi:hypothetical protein
MDCKSQDNTSLLQNKNKVFFHTRKLLFSFLLHLPTAFQFLQSFQALTICVNQNTAFGIFFIVRKLNEVSSHEQN